MLMDSNIYAAQLEHAALRQFIGTYAPAVSVVSYIEMLGYHRLYASSGGSRNTHADPLFARRLPWDFRHPDHHIPRHKLREFFLAQFLGSRRPFR